jgi:hypothetical protein
MAKRSHRDLGGDVSTQQDAVISLAIKTKLLLAIAGAAA